MLLNSQFEPILDVPLTFTITSARWVSKLSTLSCKELFLTTLFWDKGHPFFPRWHLPFILMKILFSFFFCPTLVHPKEISLPYLDIMRAVRVYLYATAFFRQMNPCELFQMVLKAVLRLPVPLLLSGFEDCSAVLWVTIISASFSIQAHSTMAVSTSWACRNQASVSQVCKVLSWSSFFHFFLRLMFLTLMFWPWCSTTGCLTLLFVIWFGFPLGFFSCAFKAVWPSFWSAFKHPYVAYFYQSFITQW